MKAHVFALCLSLSLCLGLPLPALAFASPFTDVQETSPYYDAILWAAETGVTNGTTASTFSPDAPCTRAQLAVFLWRAASARTEGSFSSALSAPVTISFRSPSRICS